MRITSLDIINDLSTCRAGIIDILDFDSKKLSVIKTKKNKIHVYDDHNPFFLAINNLKGYFEEYDGNKYLTIIFTNEYQKFMYTGILKKLIKILIKIILKLNLNLTTFYL